MHGIFGVFGTRNVRRSAQEAMMMLQSRICSSAGLAFSNNRGGFECRKIGNAISPISPFESTGPLLGVGWIQHRDPESLPQDVSDPTLIQPFIFNTDAGSLCVAIRGNSLDKNRVRDMLTASVGTSPTITSDALNRLIKNLGRVTMILATPETLFGYASNAPLFMLNDDGNHVMASDEAAFSPTARRKLEKIGQGSLVVCTENGVQLTPGEKRSTANYSYQT